MAGDVGVEERAIVLSPGTVTNLEAVARPIRQARGRVRHFYGPRVVIEEVPEGTAEESVRSGISGGEVATAPEGLSAEVQEDLDDIGKMGLRAFALRQSKEFAHAKAHRPLAGTPWDTDQAEAMACHPQEVPGAQVALLGDGPTSAELTGSVAVGIVIVSGPGNLAFEEEEKDKVVAEVQNGLSWLGAQNRSANITWHYDIRPVEIAARPEPDPLSREDTFRNPAMEALGYPGNQDGVLGYVEHLRESMDTDWTYCAFFTKYPLHHFAYAYGGGPYLVMSYRLPGWGVDNIDRVFAHETGHVFLAPDEYRASDCKCDTLAGKYQAPNANCTICAPGEGVQCIMKGNSWEMCAYTPVHLGWGKGWLTFNQGFDGALWRESNGKIYFFKDNLYASYSPEAEKIDTGYPRTIAGNWKNMPEAFEAGIDAALWRDDNSNIYMFKGREYVRYSEDGEGVLEGYPKPIAGNWEGLPAAFEAGIDAAFWRTSNDKIYLFKGRQYVRYTDDDGQGVDDGFPKPIAGNWRGMPADFAEGIDAVLLKRTNNKIYFFKGEQYVRYSEDTFKVDDGYPKPIAGNWKPFW
ncbi:MAG: hypothetical protein K0U98_00415 [Deltaproteobacteria bacterium]|nr:hypothetical protein [Deltaproteobacteria bacterium]